MLILWLFACKDPGADTANHSSGDLADPGVGEYTVDQVEGTVVCYRVQSGEVYEQDPLFDTRSQFVIGEESGSYTWTPVGNDGPFLYDRYTPLRLNKRSDGAWWGHVALTTEADYVDPPVPVFLSLFVTLRPHSTWTLDAEVQASFIDQSVNEDGTLGNPSSIACSWAHVVNASREG